MTQSPRPLNCDFLIIGAGVVGLAIAREIKLRYPDQSVIVLEKESAPGLHASGRNSGVLHSGIYYPAESLKARVCATGAREMAEYCVERNLPLKRTGKILTPTRSHDSAQLGLLEQRGEEQGIEVCRLDRQQLHDLEPQVGSATGQALLVPSTSVVSAPAVLKELVKDVTTANARILTNTSIIKVDTEKRCLMTSQKELRYGHAINCAGAQADRVAHLFGAAHRYTILPFRGRYWKLDPRSKIELHHLIYPVPDLRVPFLGVHTTTSIDGEIYLGPTATPAFGRESYNGLQNLRVGEAALIGSRLGRLFITGRDGFRRLAVQEAWRSTQPGFLSAAKALLPAIRKRHLLSAPHKTGIRPQMLNLRSGKLEMDFHVEQSPGATHVLNAISPAFTSAFPLARYILDTFIEAR